MLKITIGHSDDIDSAEAIEEAIVQCQKQGNDAPVKAGLLYAAIDHDFEVLLKKINETYPGIQLIGCTTDGELSSSGGFEEDSLVLGLFQSDDIEIIAGMTHGLTENLSQSIQESIEQKTGQMKEAPKLCIVNPPGFGVNGDELLKGLQQVLGQDFPIFGGHAGDQSRMEKTYQFCNDKVYDDAIPFLLFGGQFQFSFGVSNGWEPLGKEGIVTKTRGNIIYAIDHQPAIHFYKNYLGESHGHVEDFPLAVYPENEGGFFMRSALSVNEVDGSITCTGDIQEGAVVRITHARCDQILEACNDSIENSISAFKGSKIAAAICFSCAGRRKQLGTQTMKETEQLRSHLVDIQFLGFYAYGEFSPLKNNCPSFFHNCTFVTLLIGDE